MLGQVIDTYITSVFPHFHVPLFIYIIVYWLPFLYCPLGNKQFNLFQSTCKKWLVLLGDKKSNVLEMNVMILRY